MLLKVDNREHELIKKLRLYKEFHELDTVEIQVEVLPLGDLALFDASGNEVLLFERKSLNDLASSIRDGRYDEQSYRLQACSVHNHNIIYLIEGDMRFYKPMKGSPSVAALYSAMISLSYFKGFSVHRTTTMEETANFVLQVATKLHKEKEQGQRSPYYSLDLSGNSPNLPLQQTEEKAYSSVVKRVKKDNVTVDNIGEIMLMQIPTVSPVIAQTIMQQFKTLPALLSKMQTDAHCLDEIKIATKAGQARRLAKNVVQSLFQFLVPACDIAVDTETVTEDNWAIVSITWTFYNLIEIFILLLSPTLFRRHTPTCSAPTDGIFHRSLVWLRKRHHLS